MIDIRGVGGATRRRERGGEGGRCVCSACSIRSQKGLVTVVVTQMDMMEGTCTMDCKAIDRKNLWVQLHYLRFSTLHISAETSQILH